jgi:hypothetical protein
VADLFGFDLFGEPVVQKATGAVAERFTFPPFTVLDADSQPWTERRNAWEVSIGATVGSASVLCDPVLAEISYKWFSPANAIVVSDLHCVAAEAVAVGTGRTYYAGDAVGGLQAEQADFAMLMPFAGDVKDAGDAATQSVARVIGKVKRDAFACFVCPALVAPSGRQIDTLGIAVAAMQACGWRYYNEVAFLSPPELYTAARATYDGRLGARGRFDERRELHRRHTLVAYFVLGDSKRASRLCDTSGIGIKE